MPKATQVDPRDLTYAARRLQGLVYDILVARTIPQTGNDVRLVVDVMHETQVIPDWPLRSAGHDARRHAFDNALVELIAAGVVEQVDNRFAPTSMRAVRMREFADAAGPEGFRQPQLAEAIDWASPQEMDTILRLGRECGAIIRPHDRGRFYSVKHAPTEYVYVVTAYSAYGQEVPSVEASDHTEYQRNGGLAQP